MAIQKTRRVELVLLDVMFTILSAIGSRAEHLARLLQKVIKISVDPDAVWRAVTKYRQLHPRAGQDMGLYWPKINRLALSDMCQHGHLPPWVMLHLDRYAAAWHEEHYSEGTEYEIRADMRALLEWCVGSQIPIGIASNQSHVRLVQLLREHDVLRYFSDAQREDQHVYTSERLCVAKPSRTFFQEIRKRENAVRKTEGRACIESIRQFALIGNSIENDGKAADLGIPVCIIDTSGKLVEASSTITAGVRPVRNGGEAREWVGYIYGHGRRDDLSVLTGLIPPSIVGEDSSGGVTAEDPTADPEVEDPDADDDPRDLAASSHGNGK